MEASATASVEAQPHETLTNIVEEMLLMEVANQQALMITVKVQQMFSCFCSLLFN
jgi:hypothetical protein